MGQKRLHSKQVLHVSGQTVYFNNSESLDFIEDESVDFIMTSPPYWNLKDYGHKNQIGSSDYETYLGRLNNVWNECYRIAKPNAIFVLNVGNRRHNKQFIPIGYDIYGRMKDWKLWDSLIWYIPNALPQPRSYIERLFDNKYELLLIFTKDGGNSDYTFHKPRVENKYKHVDPRKNKMNPRGRCLGNILRIPAYRPPNVKTMNYHIASYPDELVSIMLETMTNECDVVFDPFLGSGTTLKISRAMNRKGIGVELNSDFRDTIRNKICEPFKIPDWKTLDIIHSTTMDTGNNPRRRMATSNGINS
ncbi:MAG: site-specific DNA-methyltransferase [Candidatus Nitrosoabyssus spongiisocia]|nr:MAG: site-specific DNA-methyltransferase [Nitrosopumilaceae archaeon AB1(1)]